MKKFYTLLFKNNAAKLCAAFILLSLLAATGSFAATRNNKTAKVGAHEAADALLANLKVNTSKLSPVFSPAQNDYTVTVNSTIAKVRFIPTTDDGYASVTVNGISVVSGKASQAIPLNYGVNNIAIVVTASDWSTTNTYNVVVTRRVPVNATLASLTLSAGSLSPDYDPNIVSYNVGVPYAVSSVTVTPTTTDPLATVKVNSVITISGSASHLIALNAGSNTVSVVVTGHDGTVNTYSLIVNRAFSVNSKLFAFGLNVGSVSPAFNPDITTYTQRVANTIALVRVKPVSEANSTITVNGVAVATGSPSQAIALAVGDNVITTIVTAQDGVSTTTYTLTVTRAGSSNAKLAGLVLSSGPLSPDFDTNTNDYTASLPYASNGVTVTPTVTEPHATVTVNGTAVASGSASGNIPVHVGPNTITTVVTAQNGITLNTYTITITRAKSANANLSALSLSTGHLSPAFDQDSTSYTASVAASVAAIRAKPVTAESSATITVNGQAVTSGAASQAISLSIGANTVTTQVTAANGVATKTYTVTVYRGVPVPAVHSLFESVSVQQPTANAQFANEIAVHQGLSPNGDGRNDVLTIDGIKNYPDNSLKIMSRNGALVFEAKGYDNSTKAFDGRSNTTGKLQQPGTYFYSLDYKVKGEIKHKTGFITLKY